MGKIKKYQTGGGTKPYYDLKNDYAEPGARKREAAMIEELTKRGPVYDTAKAKVKAPTPKPKPKPVIKKKAKGGASLKPVPADRQKSLGKLPTAVRNKMGYQKNGGKMKKARGGATLSPSASNVSKRLGSRLRAGGTLSPVGSNVTRRLSSPFKKKARGGATLAPSKKNTSNRLASNLKMKTGGGVKKAMGGYKMMMTGGKCRGGCY